MERSRVTELRVGIFVMVALIIGGSLAFVIGNQRNLFRAKTEYFAIFDGVGGLRPGAPIMVAGVNVGSVDDVEIQRDGRIRVELEVIDDATSLVRQGSVASIGNKGLLGDKQVEITVGEGQPLPSGSEIPTAEPADIGRVMAQASAMMEDAEATVHNLRVATEALGDPAFAESLKQTTRNLATITHLVAEGDGAVNKLLRDPQTGQDVQETLANFRRTSNELASAARSVRAIADEVRSGDGSAHRLIYGPEAANLAANLADASGEAAQMMRDIRTGDGTLHDLVYEDSADQLLANLTAASDDIRAITSDVRAGRGTIGAFLQDPSVYEDVKRLVGDLQRNQILRALVRYSIRRDDSSGPVEVEAPRASDGQ